VFGVSQCFSPLEWLCTYCADRHSMKNDSAGVRRLTAHTTCICELDQIRVSLQHGDVASVLATSQGANDFVWQPFLLIQRDVLTFREIVKP
jgi:hypothetical protein